MGVLANVHIDGSSFSTATGIWSDSALTTYATTGWYSDGSIARYWNSSTGLLGPVATCPDCEVECSDIVFSLGSGTTTDPSSPPASGSVGKKFITNFDTKTGVGAVVIRFNPGEEANGINVKYEGNTYRTFSTQGYGRKTTGSNAIWLGNENATDCDGAELHPRVNGKDFDDFLFDGTSFNPLGSSGSLTITAGNVQTTTTAPGECVMVLNKANAASSNVQVNVYGLCAGDDWSLSLECPATLPSFSASSDNLTKANACGATIDQTYYYVHVKGSNGNLALYDFVFNDPDAATPADDGWYRISTGLAIRVSNGIIDSISPCDSTVKTRRATRCYDGKVFCMSGIPNSLSGGEPVFSLEQGNCIFEKTNDACDGSEEGNITYSSTSSPNTCENSCVLIEFTNSASIDKTVSYTDCFAEAQTLTVTANSTNSICLGSFVASSLDSDITYTRIDCDCDGLNKYVATLCGDSTVSLVVGHTSTLTPGTLVKTTDTDPGTDCVYVVEQSSTDSIQAYVTSVLTGETCADQSITYKITNTENVAYSYTFTNPANGLVLSGQVPAGSVTNPSAVLVCCVPDSLNLPFGPSGLSYEVHFCNCT